MKYWCQVAQRGGTVGRGTKGTHMGIVNLPCPGPRATQGWQPGSKMAVDFERRSQRKKYHPTLPARRDPAHYPVPGFAATLLSSGTKNPYQGVGVAPIRTRLWRLEDDDSDHTVARAKTEV